MLFKRGRKITGVFAQGKVIKAVHYGARLVWEAIRSCFGSGKWVDKYPWLDKEVWKDK